MMTVRFDTGFSVQYNRATFIRWASVSQSSHMIFEREGGGLIACVPGSAIVEWISPCRTYNARDESKDAEILALKKQIEQQRKRIRRLQAKP